jgi:uncharacterized protein YutE (UPF0331/DUF86 family)
MPEVNLDRLRGLVGQLRDARRQLDEMGALSREGFLGDRRTVNAAKYLLIVATEAALDICTHLAARRGGRSPEDYATASRSWPRSGRSMPTCDID